MSLPITSRQMNVLKALQWEDPDLGELAIAIAQAFDATRVENPELVALILDKTCRRMVAREPGSQEAIVRHLAIFGKLNCLTPAQVSDFTDRVRRHG
ncbi:hypothetical protein ALP50_01925 [Pseudomonas syringae pv. spinaceae]|uniref:Uncharacterized protein n=1 Tax=Pseudomonas syringae pv. spinaceae TaxID=264459 RepID=A0A0P9ZL85_PSESX|nr:hypothetical protein [Pseudomonas syringae]KPY61235.1 Uncharacterized protein ALO94_02410 [Pseudomonas syringae pv. spinaceae]RMT36453.1 hypothetical protein ALP50_01925 [Pseudomonas syringae pv. spinaceae]